MNYYYDGRRKVACYTGERSEHYQQAQGSEGAAPEKRENGHAAIEHHVRGIGGIVPAWVDAALVIVIHHALHFRTARHNLTPHACTHDLIILVAGCMDGEAENDDVAGRDRIARQSNITPPGNKRTNELDRAAAFRIAIDVQCRGNSRRKGRHTHIDATGPNEQGR